MAELKPCPFCGSRENAIKEHWMCRNMWCVQCYGCGCNSACFRTKEEAIEAWNRRSDDNCTDDDTAEWIYKKVRGTMTNVCSVCGSCSVYPDKYCGGCGRSMKNGY